MNDKDIDMLIRIAKKHGYYMALTDMIEWASSYSRKNELNMISLISGINALTQLIDKKFEK